MESRIKQRLIRLIPFMNLYSIATRGGDAKLGDVKSLLIQERTKTAHTIYKFLKQLSTTGYPFNSSKVYKNLESGTIMVTPCWFF